MGFRDVLLRALAVVAEEFQESKITMDRLADVLEGAIIKRRMHGRDHGVAILSEGLAEKLDLESLGPVERDQYGNVRLAELDLGRVLKDRVAGRLRERKVDVTIVGKDLGRSEEHTSELQSQSNLVCR